MRVWKARKCRWRGGEGWRRRRADWKQERMGIAMVHTCMDIGVRYPFVLFMNIIRFPLLQKVLLGQGNLRLETETVLAGCSQLF